MPSGAIGSQLPIEGFIAFGLFVLAAYIVYQAVAAIFRWGLKLLK